MKPFTLSLFMSFLAFSSLSHALTLVAFLEVYDSNGKLVQYEPQSRFGHVAIQVGSLWLESSPTKGVHLATWEDLRSEGRIADVIQVPLNLTVEDVAPFLGKPFDFRYSWDDQSYYCSELIGKILKIKPQPLHFNHEIWPPSYWPLEGQPGLSPDKIYRKLKGPGPYL